MTSSPTVFRCSFFFVLSQFFFSLSASVTLNQSLINHPSNPEKKVECIWAQPQNNNDRHPVIILLHGASQRGGANEICVYEIISYWIEKGFMAIGISLPGYGKSEGPNDFCGPYTMNALNEVIRTFKEEFDFDSDIGIVGFGVGGLAATLLSSQRNDLSFVISANGIYDLEKHLGVDDPIRRATEKKKCFAWEDEELRIRSPQAFAHLIKTPLFLLHRDPRFTVAPNEVEHFADTVNQTGGECAVRFLPCNRTDQRFSHATVIRETEDWIFQHIQK